MQPFEKQRVKVTMTNLDILLYDLSRIKMLSVEDDKDGHKEGFVFLRGISYCKKLMCTNGIRMAFYELLNYHVILLLCL